MVDNNVVLVDEYYSILVKTKLIYDSKKRINPIFNLGSISKCYLSTGHNSLQTRCFLSEYYGASLDY